MPDTKQARSPATAARRQPRQAAQARRGAERRADADDDVADPAPAADPQEDAVTYASWESFPASDAPGWR